MWRCVHGVLVTFVALAHEGKVPRLNMAVPHVLMPRLMLKMPMMLRMKPAFAFKQKENTIIHPFFHKQCLKNVTTRQLTETLKTHVKCIHAIPYPRLWGCHRRKQWRWVEWLQEAWKPAMRWWCRAASRREDGARWSWPANSGDILLALPYSSYIFEKLSNIE